MVLTADVTLPEESELTVQEVNLSAAALRAGSFHLGKYCEQANNVSYCLSLLIQALVVSSCYREETLALQLVFPMAF